jgi:hypothetical protein
VTSGTEPADNTFFYGNGNADQDLGKGFFIHKVTVDIIFNTKRLLVLYSECVHQLRINVMT